ncbi:MAG: FAD-dependent oxidoreductase [Myxococcota bacterium]
MRVHVVGAGAFGCAAALELAVRGHDVVLSDAGPVPHPDAASTDLSKLIRADYGDDTFLRDRMWEALPRWRAWNERFSRPRFHEVGLHVVCPAFTPGTFERDSFDRLEHTTRIPDLREVSPRWAAPLEGYTSEEAGWAESGAVIAELVQWCRDAGVQVRENVRIDGPEARTHGFDVAVVAPGAWLPVVVPELADRMRAVGQPVLHFRPADPDRFRPPHFLPWCCDIANTGWYGFPANADGIVKVANHGAGHPTDPRGPREVPAHWEGRFRDFFAAHLPELVDAPLVGSRLCLYADTFDGDFVIARHPERAEVIAGGGSGHAFKFTPILGELVANAVEGREDARLARFAWRPLTQGRTERARHAATPGSAID